MGARLEKFIKLMDRIASAEADITEAGGWGNKAEADFIRPKGGRPAKPARRTSARKNRT